MKQMMTKLKKQAGFTLVEALIVLAILGVLAAVAIPTYNAQLESGRQAVDNNTLSAATSMAVTDYLLNGYTGAEPYTVYRSTSTTGDADNITVAATSATAPAGFAEVSTGVSTLRSGKKMEITITNGMVTVSRWQA